MKVEYDPISLVSRLGEKFNVKIVDFDEAGKFFCFDYKRGWFSSSWSCIIRASYPDRDGYVITSMGLQFNERTLEITNYLYENKITINKCVLK